MGTKCRFNGTDKLNKKVMELAKKETLIPVCPDLLVGMFVPRGPFEIIQGTGQDVLDGRSKVISKEGKDFTQQFTKAAKLTLELTRVLGIKEMIGKQKSPTCGCGQIFDGTFSGKLINGDGVATAYLKKNGIKVISEEEIQ